MGALARWLGTAPGRLVGGVTVVVLLGLGAWGTTQATLDQPAGGPGMAGLALSGSPALGQAWSVAYGTSAVAAALRGLLLVVVCWSPLLALLALWTGRSYRTVSTRRLAAPLALVALGAGVAGLVGVALLQLASNGTAGLDPWSPEWRLAAATAWAALLAGLLVAAYSLGGVLSLGLRPSVRAVLRTADSEAAAPAERTMDESGLGLAFSGGGIRAASISLGALQALERNGSRGWDKADHVTSVSGGSYMTGAWSLARTLAPSGDERAAPRPWAMAGIQPGPEERHLRDNLGYLLSNAPRGSGDDSVAPTSEPAERARAQRLPAAVATVLTGMLANALVFFGLLWVAGRLLGWFYRWYFGLTCPGWRVDRHLAFELDHGCLAPSPRVAWPVVALLAVGLGFVLVWVLASKFSDASGAMVPPAWLLVPKFLGYGSLRIGLALLFVMGVLPLLIDLLWRPIAAHDLFTTLVTVVGSLGSISAVLRILRKPLAKVAPVLGGVLFATLLLFLLCRWALGAMAVAPGNRNLVLFTVVVLALLAVHLGGTVEFWSLAGFYRGKLRSAFATYRTGGTSGVRVRAYVNNDVAASGEKVEPTLASLPVRGPGRPNGTPLTICASATVTGRGVRTHYGVPALSVTFSPEAVRLFAPLEEDGLWQRFECPTEAMATLRPRLSPRLTTMMAVGLSGAAVSPAMGRFRLGPISMLLAFANIRLGAWIPNPRWAATLAAQGKPLPRPGLGYLLKEFVGFHDPSDLYLYVTDGGHWENTALVELLRTSHHREIICVDADSGPGNLATSISRAVDLAQLECAASIALNLDVLRAEPDPSPGRDYSPRSVNLGLVRRSDGNDERISLLWYAKPALTQDMPPQLLAYREVDPTFPRISTIDQFFHAAQFAAYRDLGRYNARKILAARATLATHVRAHPTYIRFRAAVRAGILPEPPEGWVLPELVDLVEQLAADRITDEQAMYAERVYSTVVAALA